jgi:hypothetical protein
VDDDFFLALTVRPLPNAILVEGTFGCGGMFLPTFRGILKLFGFIGNNIALLA